jgi:hypothetical protein
MALEQRSSSGLSIFDWLRQALFEDASNNNFDPQQEETIGDTESEEESTVENETPISNLVQKAFKARDKLNILFARHSLNSGSNHVTLVTLAETACVIDERASMLAEKQLRVELLTRELLMEKVARQALQVAAAPELPLTANIEVNTPEVLGNELEYEVIPQAEAPPASATQRRRKRRFLFRW